MAGPLNGIHYHVIDIDFYVPPCLVGEYNIHESLVCGANNLEIEGHDIVLVVSMI